MVNKEKSITRQVISDFFGGIEIQGKSPAMLMGEEVMDFARDMSEKVTGAMALDYVRQTNASSIARKYSVADSIYETV